MGRKPRLRLNAVRLITLLGLLAGFAAGASAGNLVLERRISEQLDTPALVGQALWLEAGPVRFLAILEASRAPQRHGGVILLHDAGEHADWQQVITPLRHHLAAQGWDTLSVQLPLADNPLQPALPAGLPEEALPRIQAAVDQLKSRGIDNLVLIGHGLGARMALHYLAGNPSASVHALVAIGLEAAERDDPVMAAIGKPGVPMLDLYGSLDLPAVVGSATARRSAALHGERKDYRQDRVTGADHQFTGLQETLQQHVEAWMRRVTGDRAGGANARNRPNG